MGLNNNGDWLQTYSIPNLGLPTESQSDTPKSSLLDGDSDEDLVTTSDGSIQTSPPLRGVVVPDYQSVVW